MPRIARRLLINTVGICAMTLRHLAAFYIIRSIWTEARINSSVPIITPGSRHADPWPQTLSGIRKVMAISKERDVNILDLESRDLLYPELR